MKHFWCLKGHKYFVFIRVKISKNNIWKKGWSSGVLINISLPNENTFEFFWHSILSFSWLSFGRSTPLLAKANQYCPTDFCEIVLLKAKHEPGPSLPLTLMEERCVQITQNTLNLHFLQLCLNNAFTSIYLIIHCMCKCTLNVLNGLNVSCDWLFPYEPNLILIHWLGYNKRRFPSRTWHLLENWISKWQQEWT